MSSDLTEQIARAYDTARLNPRILPTARMFFIRRRRSGLGWEGIPVESSSFPERSSINGEVFTGWLPKPALGFAPLFVQFAELEPWSRELIRTAEGIGFMPDDSYSSAIVYNTSGQRIAVPTLPTQRVWEFTGTYTKDVFTPASALSGLSAPLSAALGG